MELLLQRKIAIQNNTRATAFNSLLESEILLVKRSYLKEIVDYKKWVQYCSQRAVTGWKGSSYTSKVTYINLYSYR